MPTLLLIKPKEITEQTPLGGNIDVSRYRHVIKESQVFVIEPILGTTLYKKILTDYGNDTLTGIYEEIHENYIKPILIYNVSAEFIIIHSYNVADAGIFKNQPENAQAVSKNEVDYLAQNQRNKADTYINRLEKFLCKNAHKIPEYKTDSTQDVNPIFFRVTGWQK